MSSSTYETGYGKPPRHSRFKAGRSGNPKGRERGSRNLATDVSEELAEKLLITEGGKPRRVTKQRAVIKALVARSLKGDAKAATALLRLIPSAEQARTAAVQARSLSESDAEILAALREQLVEEINKQGDSCE